MSKYIMRLDDAAPHRNIKNWDRMEMILDQFHIKPLVGVIPACADKGILQYEKEEGFWQRVHRWKAKGWEIAMHGYSHVYITKEGGINPVQYRSEFAGVDLEIQKEKIALGIAEFCKHDIEPKVFFAPSHTFDYNTLQALTENSNIRIISDTIANKPYVINGITFIPQQSGRVRRLPFAVVTFCYHPNIMTEKEFEELEGFLKCYYKKFVPFPVGGGEFLERNLYGIGSWKKHILAEDKGYINYENRVFNNNNNRV